MCGESYCKYWARSVEANTSKQRASRALALRPRNSPIITQRGEIPSRLQCDSIRSCTLITNHESLNHDQRDAGDASQFELIVTEETERRKERGNESDTLSRDVLRLPRRCKTDLGNRNLFQTRVEWLTPFLSEFLSFLSASTVTALAIHEVIWPDSPPKTECLHLARMSSKY